MHQRYTLTKAEKLKSRKRIEWVFKEGKSLSVFPFKVFYLLVHPPTAPPTPPSPLPPTPPSPQAIPPQATLPSPQATPPPSTPPQSISPQATLPPSTPPQAGFGAGSRHFKKAVDRNRIKRLSREAYRLQKQPLIDVLAEKGLSMALFFIYTGKELPDHNTVKVKIGVLLQKLIKEVK
jgi:ribonuclease P protein component